MNGDATHGPQRSQRTRRWFATTAVRPRMEPLVQFCLVFTLRAPFLRESVVTDQRRISESCTVREGGST